MTTLTSRATPLPSPLPNGIPPELEPDKAWKDALRAKIEQSMSSMVEDAKKNYQGELNNGQITTERRDALDREYTQAMQNLRALAQDAYTVELERERQERRWAAGVGMTPEWGGAFVQEQKDIWNGIKGVQKEAQSPTAAEPPPEQLTRANGHITPPPGDSPIQEDSEAAAAELAKERRERSLRGLERLQRESSFSVPSSPDVHETSETQKQQEEQARRIQERKERERREWERQEKLDQDKARKRKEKEEDAKREKEREQARAADRERLEKERLEKVRQEQMERDRLEKVRLEKARQEKARQERIRQDRERQERERQERERQDREHQERERQERERQERERQEKERQDKLRQQQELLEQQRLANEREKERKEWEKQERERQERQEQERQERERQEREKKEQEERNREEEERKKRSEEEKIAARIDRERWEREQMAKYEQLRRQEEALELPGFLEDEHEYHREWPREKRSRQHQEEYPHVRGLEHDEPLDSLPNGHSSSSSTESGLSDREDTTDLSDGVATDALELLSPPPPVRPITMRKELPNFPMPALVASLPPHSPASDRPTARSPPNASIHQIWKPSSIEDDTPSRPLSTGIGRRNSVTSIKSAGSTGLRPSITEQPIPEWSDEVEYDDQNSRFVDLGEGRSSMSSTPREREKRREHRKSSASDKARSDDNFAHPNPRNLYRAEDNKPISPRDGYDREQGYGGNLRAHRSEEIPSRTQSGGRSLRREPSFHAPDEYDNDSFSSYPPARPMRNRASFEERPPVSYSKPSLQGRVPSRPSSTLNEDRDFYDQVTHRPYPTPPSSASRSSGREPLTRHSSLRTDPPSSYTYVCEPRSNTLKYAEQSESPPTRRLSESRPSLNREPSYTQSFSEEPRSMQMHVASPTGPYSRTYERAASASIPISSRQHRPSYGQDDAEGWKSWVADSHLSRREPRREPERRDRYNDVDEFQEPEYSGRGGRDYELWHPESHSPPYYGPNPEPSRRDYIHPVRSPMASHPGSYHDAPKHSFGGRERPYERDIESDEYTEEMDTDIEPPRFPTRSRREDLQRAEDERRRRLLEEERRRAAEEEEERRETERRETKQKRKDAKKQAAEAARLEEETREREQEAARKLKEKEDEIRRKAEAVKKKEAEARRKEELVKKKEAEARKEMEEIRRKEEEAKRMEEEARRKEEEVKRMEEEARRKEEEARRKEEEVRRKEVAAREEARRVREENWAKEQEMLHREEELRKREEELQRREKEIAAQKEAEKQREEEESRKEAERLQREFDQERFAEEQRKLNEQMRYEQQQEEFRRREQEIQERKRQDSTGASSYASFASATNSSTARSHPPPSAANAQSPGWSSASKSSTTSKASSSTAPKPRSGSMNSTFPTSTPSPHPPSAFDETEWKRRQEEHFQQQQERFRKEQQRFEDSRQRTDSKQLTREGVASILERHDRLWATLLSATATNLHWESIPWPLFTPPKSPEDITLSAVTAYMQSPLLPEKEKNKPPKDRIKEQIRKWHPDRFDTKCLPRVVEAEQEMVKEGTGTVIRLLNELLTKVNTPGLFG